jgi:F-type H+-transporting ATPase subunit b
MNINLTLIAQAVAFAVFIWFTVKFVWPPLLRAIEQRQSQIADGLAAAEKGRQSLEVSSKQAEAAIAEARARAQLIDEAKNAAREESGREKAAAKAEIDQEVSRAREALRDQVAALAVAGAEKILRKEINAQAHADLLSQLKKEI